MFKSVKEIYLLAGSHKFNCVLTHKVAPIEIIDRIITENIDKSFEKELNRLEIITEIA